ncbi:MAG: hypothetical protein KIS96_11380 [Bauldia sp.]|nr:hypothetical protein [Bauldia sp.]MCW5697317.1 hypothetical protein [Bauldia sp.]
MDLPELTRELDPAELDERVETLAIGIYGRFRRAIDIGETPERMWGRARPVVQDCFRAEAADGLAALERAGWRIER